MFHFFPSHAVSKPVKLEDSERVSDIASAKVQGHLCLWSDTTGDTLAPLLGVDLLTLVPQLILKQFSYLSPSPPSMETIINHFSKEGRYKSTKRSIGCLCTNNKHTVRNCGHIFIYNSLKYNKVSWDRPIQRCERPLVWKSQKKEIEEENQKMEGSPTMFMNQQY